MLHLSNRPHPITAIPPGFRLRVVASAGAGFPSPAQDWEDDALSLIELLRIDRPAAFVFRISGSSMVEAGIEDHDIVVVDRDARQRNGSIVIATVEGGFVCRQLCIKSGVAYLEHRNSRLTYPICICDETVEIFGVVRASVRDHQR
ncbi:LexA family protein [Aureimonas sp. AU40]|uniref:LexA family protein n=1 Tax=Aureimonas sp. AU40 TaxID=1637747 RepID=UPI000785ED78|nr:S24 family peptidase [Aureimonas sp. AU40]